MWQISELNCAWAKINVGCLSIWIEIYIYICMISKYETVSPHGSVH